MQAIKASGNGSVEFDPRQWLSEDRTTATVNADPGNVGFGAGPRVCPGKQLATMEMVTLLAILVRQVSKIEMSKEELEMDYSMTGGHPTDMTLSLIPRTPPVG